MDRALSAKPAAEIVLTVIYRHSIIAAHVNGKSLLKGGFENLFREIFNARFQSEQIAIRP
jgi:hypothetical protein